LRAHSRSEDNRAVDFVGGKIKGYVGPKDLGAGDDIEAVIIAFIERATETIDVAVQELDSVPIAEALISRRRAGVNVRVVLNHSYLQDETDEQHRPAATLTTVAHLAGDAKAERHINRNVFAALCRCGIEVRIDFNPTAIFHQKFCLVDLRLDSAGRARKTDRASLLTGSVNFTDTDCHTNLNHLLVFEDHDVQMEFATEFAEIWGGEFGRGRLGKAPKTHGVRGVPVKVLFAPDHAPEAEVVKQLLKCPRGGRIDGAMFTFAGSSAIDDAMIVLAGAERTVRVVLDRGQSTESKTWSAARWLQEGGVEVLVPRRRSGFRKLHHKLCVVDGSTVVAGSFNYTEPATLFNDEALLVIGSPHPESEGVKVDAAACAEIAGFFRAEIDRIAGDADAWPAH
jgi:phosphatidylserine/phosphatidylglycerophosphate/cardiolipin synthase-like enzyme